MADPGNVRVRRHRLHASGDHTMCLVGRCEQATPDDDGSHEVEDILFAYLGGETTETAVRAAILIAAGRACDQSPSPGTVNAVAEAFRVYQLRRGQ